MLGNSSFRPLVGSLADRLPRLGLLVWTNVGLAGLLASLLLVRSARELWLLFAVMLAYGLSHVLRDAAEAGLLQAALPPTSSAGSTGNG
jgi:nitrate/nitrite transporter NarK